MSNVDTMAQAIANRVAQGVVHSVEERPTVNREEVQTMRDNRRTVEGK